MLNLKLEADVSSWEDLELVIDMVKLKLAARELWGTGNVNPNGYYDFEIFGSEGPAHLILRSCTKIERGDPT